MGKAFAWATIACSRPPSSGPRWPPTGGRSRRGKEVILRDDGTWFFLEEPPKEKATEKAARSGRDGQAEVSKLAYEGKRGNFALYVTPKVWKKSENPNNPVAELEFVDPDNDAYAMVSSGADRDRNSEERGDRELNALTYRPIVKEESGSSTASRSSLIMSQARGPRSLLQLLLLGRRVV